MTKDEILKKAQKRNASQLDEMELDILQKSNSIGMLVGVFVCLGLMVVKSICDQPYQDVYAVYCAIMCGQYMYKWIRQREKHLLFVGLLWGTCAVVLLIAYLTKIL